MFAGWPVCTFGLLDTRVASFIKEGAGSLGTNRDVVAGCVCKLTIESLPGARLPGREAPEELFKPGAATVTPSNIAAEDTFEAIVSWRVYEGTWSLVRVRLQGAAPLGGYFDDGIVSERLRTIIHHEMNSNPSRARLPRAIVVAEN
jgi:hypothetical protein